MRFPRSLFCSALVLVGVPLSAQTVTLLGYTATAPSGWAARAPSSSMRLAEFTAADGAEVVVYFFGKSQGGSVEANITRWRTQFSNPDGSAVREKISSDSAMKFPTTFAEFHGTYARGIGAGSPDQAKPNQQLVAAIVETPNGTMYVQLFGNDAAVSAQRTSLVKFLGSLH